MKVSFELEWKELAAIIGFLLIALGAGVTGTYFLKESKSELGPAIQYNPDGNIIYEVPTIKR